MSHQMTTFIKQHALTTVMGLLVSGMLLFFTLNVRAIMGQELKSYVTITQLESYIKAHQDWSNEVIKRLENEHQEDRQSMAELKDEIKLLRQELRRPTPPVRYDPTNED